MSFVRYLLALVRALAADRTRLAIENVVLRQQLNVPRRNAKRPMRKGSDRAFWVLMRRLLKDWKEYPIEHDRNDAIDDFAQVAPIVTFVLTMAKWASANQQPRPVGWCILCLGPIVPIAVALLWYRAHKRMIDRIRTSDARLRNLRPRANSRHMLWVLVGAASLFLSAFILWFAHVKGYPEAAG